jgi:hypothetical protein
MAREIDDLNDERTGGSDTETERVRGVADEGDEFDEDSDDMDDEEEDEDDDSSAL